MNQNRFNSFVCVCVFIPNPRFFVEQIKKKQQQHFICEFCQKLMSYFHYLFIHSCVFFCFLKLINLDSNKKVTDILECEFKSDDGALCRYHPEGVNIFDE